VFGIRVDTRPPSLERDEWRSVISRSLLAGFTTAHWEDDPPCGFALDNHLGRIRIVAVTLIAYAVLQCIVLVRYAADVNWAMPTAWIWIAVLVIMLLMNSWAALNSNSTSMEP